MIRYKTSDRLREQAKDKLDGKFIVAIGIMLFGNLLIMLIEQGIQSVLIQTNITTGISGYIISLLISLLCSIVLGVFEIGYAYFYLNAYCGEPYHVADLVYGYQNKPSVSFSLTTFFSIFTFLASEPARLLFLLATRTGEIRYVTYALLIETFALILLVYVWLRFHLAIYLFLDFPDKSFGELLRLSSRLMKGHKLRLLYLRLSFIPLYILGICSCGVGFLWITPYISMTDICFFMDLMNPEEIPDPPKTESQFIDVHA